MNSKHNNIVDFDAFVKRQQAGSSEDEGVDWEKERDEWLGYLKELYRQTESFLEEYTKTGQIKLTYRKIELNEENIGSYNADQAILKIGRQEITMTPVGTLIIGAKGRVEVVGSAGRARLVLVDSEASGPRIKVNVSVGRKPEPMARERAPRKIKWAWKIATSPPTIRYIELTKESLFQMLMEVANA
ncbi:MAG: hypothetical protein WBE37_03265 [Bryobacteraceae bacterium]